MPTIKTGLAVYYNDIRLSVARNYGLDVVLIDTAGRMQDNEPLMRALSKVDFKKKKCSKLL